MRFRRTEDEVRYHAIRVELYLRIAQALRGSPELCSDILRNLGKLEHAAFYEGVDQGVCAAVIASVALSEDELTQRSAADLHRFAYEYADTPLSAIEDDAWNEVTGGADKPACLTAPRAEYAPMTLAELEGSARPSVSVGSEHDPHVIDDFPEPLTAGGELGERLQDETGQVVHRNPHTGDVIAVPRLKNDELEASPEKLDQIREALLDRVKAGFAPTEFKDVVLALMEATQLPAYVIDQQLATHQGRAVLDQAKLFDLKPSNPFELPSLDGIEEQLAELANTVDASEAAQEGVPDELVDLLGSEGIAEGASNAHCGRSDE